MREKEREREREKSKILESATYGNSARRV